MVSYFTSLNTESILIRLPLVRCFNRLPLIILVLFNGNAYDIEYAHEYSLIANVTLWTLDVWNCKLGHILQTEINKTSKVQGSAIRLIAGTIVLAVATVWHGIDKWYLQPWDVNSKPRIARRPHIQLDMANPVSSCHKQKACSFEKTGFLYIVLYTCEYTRFCSNGIIEKETILFATYSSVQFNSLFGLKLFPKIQFKYTHTNTKSKEHKYKGFEHNYRSMAQQSRWVINPQSTMLHHLSEKKKKYSVHTELINTSISSLWNWGIYQWSARMFNKQHKSNPFPFSFSSVLAEFLLLINFLFRPIGVLLKIALKAKSWTIALLLDIKESKKFLNLLIKLSRICSHPTIYGSRYLCVRYGKLKILLTAFCHAVHISSNDF